MEARKRKDHTIQDQENANANKGKNDAAKRLKRQNAVCSPWRRDVPTANVATAAENIEKKADVPTAKEATAVVNIEKKSLFNIEKQKTYSKYKNVQAKVNTGLAVRPVRPKARDPLTGEESTGIMAGAALPPE